MTIRRFALLGSVLVLGVIGSGVVVNLIDNKPINSLNSWCMDETNASGKLGNSMCPFVPEASDGTSSDLDVTSAVRDWVSQNMVVAAGVSETYGPERHWEIPAMKQIESMAKHEYGYYCGSFAQVLSEIYSELGLKAKTYNFGDARSFSHVVTLVTLPGGGQDIVQDAFYGGLLVNSAGKPVSLAHALSALNRGGELRYQNSPSNRKYLIEAKEEKDAATSGTWLQLAADQTSCAFIRDSQEGSLKIFSCVSQDYSYSKVELDERAKTFLEGKELPLNLFQLLKFPIA